MKAAIIGTTGYTGLLLLRILESHPDIEEIIPVSSSKAGTHVSEFDPGFVPSAIEAKMKATGGKAVSLEEAAKMDIDVVFAALPHLKSAELCGPFFGKSVVIDLSADLRIKDEEIFKKAYGVEVPRPDLLEKAVYGLPEWFADDIKKADIIAGPGCYPTSALLPLLPLLKEGIISPSKIIVNSISGISGAGKKLMANLLFCERTENAGAYNPGRIHRHTLEIETYLKGENSGSHVLFTPHLAPVKRGMVTTTYVDLKKEVTHEKIRETYNKYYSQAPFVNLRDSIPQSRDVWGTNRCDMAFHMEGDTLILMSAIDNLIKGSTGQVVQCMNLRFGLEETAGLKLTNEL